MFSQACIIPSVHEGGIHGKRGHAWQRGACVVKGACVAGVHLVHICIILSNVSALSI